jgi:hypothetical protein
MTAWLSAHPTESFGTAILVFQAVQAVYMRGVRREQKIQRRAFIQVCAGNRRRALEILAGDHHGNEEEIAA